jgi:hypothetical protein
MVPGALISAPEAGEWVVNKALVERGFSLPPSDFFTEMLKASFGARVFRSVWAGFGVFFSGSMKTPENTSKHFWPVR